MSQPYSKKDPFFAGLKDRYNLCSQESKKETFHLSLDIEPSGLIYSVGDCIGICPDNDSSIVEALISLLKIPRTEKVVDKRTQEEYTFFEYLTRKANLAQVNKKLFVKLAEKALTENIKIDFLKKIEGDPQGLREYLAKRDVLHCVQEAGPIKIDPQEFVDELLLLVPRFYSIASSMKVHPAEVHLIVAKVTYQGIERSYPGVCTHFLSERIPLNEPIVPIFLQPHSGFTVPEDPSQNIIMIGPGTGVAPFRAFMQERIATGATGKNWLFYGDWFSEGTFLYKDFWRLLEKEDCLKLDLAFSRDQIEKIYVQHRMLEQGKELYKWLEEGACLYVCGDAKKMAKDVESALIQIVIIHGSKSED